MKKIILVLIIIGLVFIFWGTSLLREERKELSVEIGEDLEGLEVIDSGGSIVFSYTIGEWRSWAEENWEKFLEEPIMIGDEEMTPDRFYYFNAAAVSPDFRKLAFATSAYAMATDVSLITVIDMDSLEKSMVSRDSFGQVNNFVWSPEGIHLAYVLDTARAAGDRLSVDNIEEMRKEFTLTDKDILQKLEEETVGGQGLLPEFRDLSWSENGQKLFFVTNTGSSGQSASWSIAYNGSGLQLKEIKAPEKITRTGNLMINSPGLEEGIWYLSYEEPGAPGLTIELQIGEAECFGEDFCQKLQSEDEQLSGSRVKIEGWPEDDYFRVNQIWLLNETENS